MLRAHLADGRVGLLQKGCEVLKIMTRGDVNNRAKCGAAGGVEVLVEILRRYQVGGPALVLQEACRALRNSTYSNTANKAKCRAAGGVEVVRQIQQRYANDDARLAGLCAGLLGVLS